MKFSNFLYISQLNRRLCAIAGSALIVIFVAFSFLLPSFGAMSMAQGEMAHCPYMRDGQSMCPMTVADHVRSWVQMFSAAVPDGFGIGLILLLFTVISLRLFFDRTIQDIWRFKLFRYFLQSPDIPLFGYFRRIFSQGLLHQKIYPIAI
ncbi:MAG: hypothetical protein V1668_02020 [Patescibacteria group bacterium]